MQLIKSLEGSGSFCPMIKITFLGTGTSTGVPVVGCKCATCISEDPRNRRLRSSVHLEIGNKSLIIDSGPDFRYQVLRAGIQRLDGIMLTHSHADHLHGLDDVRMFNYHQKDPIDFFLHESEVAEVKRKFNYIFNPEQIGGGIPQIKLQPFKEEFSLYGIPVKRIELRHGIIKNSGYRIGNFAYTVDTNGIDRSELDKLRGLDVLVITGLKYEKHPTHFSIPESLEIIKEIKPKKTYFSHITHTVEHGGLVDYLRDTPDVEPAFDGMQIEVKL